MYSLGNSLARTILVGLTATGLLTSQAASVSWTNPSGGAWSAATNWSPNTVPGPADTAYITNIGTYTVTLDVASTLAGLVVGGAGGTQTISHSVQTLTLNGPGLLETNTVYNLAGG